MRGQALDLLVETWGPQHSPHVRCVIVFQSLIFSLGDLRQIPHDHEPHVPPVLVFWLLGLKAFTVVSTGVYVLTSRKGQSQDWVCGLGMQLSGGTLFFFIPLKPNSASLSQSCVAVCLCKVFIHILCSSCYGLLCVAPPCAACFQPLSLQVQMSTLSMTSLCNSLFVLFCCLFLRQGLSCVPLSSLKQVPISASRVLGLKGLFFTLCFGKAIGWHSWFIFSFSRQDFSV